MYFSEKVPSVHVGLESKIGVKQRKYIALLCQKVLLYCLGERALTSVSSTICAPVCYSTYQ